MAEVEEERCRTSPRAEANTGLFSLPLNFQFLLKINTVGRQEEAKKGKGTYCGPDFPRGEKIRGGSVRTGEQQVIRAKILPSPGECNPQPHSLLTGERVFRARCQNGRMLPQDHAKGTNSWWMANPSSGLGVLQDPNDEGAA